MTLQPLKQFILAKTEGNPFFMEEIVQALVEEGVLVRDAGAGVGARLAVPLPKDLQIPPTVQALLASRIDRLPAAEKELLQTLSVIGKEFSLSLLQQVVQQPEDTLLPLLAHLQGAEFIYEQPAFPEVEYTFKHALTQEVAYGSLLIERRKVLHERTAQAIEGTFHARLEDHYGDLAHHYSRSSNTQKAVEYLHRAGQQAVQRCAYAEAVSHLSTALEQLKILPDTLERAQRELTLQTAIGPALMATRGWAAPEVATTYTRARELCQQIGETPRLFPVLHGLCSFHRSRAEVQTARALAEQLLSLARRAQDSALLLEAHLQLGFTLSWLGEFAPARIHVEQASALYDPQRYRSHIVLYGRDSGVLGLSILSWILWFLGYPAIARKRMHEMLAVAQDLSHPVSLAMALFGAVELCRLAGDTRMAQERADALIALSTEHGFPVHLAAGTFFRGWALVKQGHTEEGMAQMRHGHDAQLATSAQIGRTPRLTMFADVYRKLGQTEKGLAVVAEALQVVHKTAAWVLEAELYRLKGGLTLQSRAQGSKLQVQSPEEEAEKDFLKAIEIAQRQQAKSLELRAVMSLARLWQQQGKKEEGRQMLAAIYGWFTEGFDTKDLQEAEALLKELT